MDMVGSINSAPFAVNDAEQFQKWFGQYTFGGSGTYAVRHEDDDKHGHARFQVIGSEQYPSVWPKQWDERDEDEHPVEMDQWAGELREHLAAGEIFYLVAGGNEGERYVAYDELAISHDKWQSRAACSDDLECARRLLDGDSHRSSSRA